MNYLNFLTNVLLGRHSRITNAIGYLDTGNTLRCNLTGRNVAVTTYAVAIELAPPELTPLLDDYIKKPSSIYEYDYRDDIPAGIHIIPYNTICSGNQLMLAMDIDYMFIDSSYMEHRPLIGISPNTFNILHTDKCILLSKYYMKSGKDIYYIGGTEVLPAPLEPHEEAVVINELTNNQSDSAKKMLIERNLRLVVYIAKKFDNTGVGIEDLISIGTIGLIKAINTFKNDKNIKLATYASRCIENEILMFLRRNSKLRTEVSIDEPLNVDWDGNELLLSDILGTDEDVVYRDLETEVDYNLLDNAISKLCEKERTIIELRYGINTIGGVEKTQKEVADLLGISQSYISRLEKRIIKKLRREIMKQY